MWELPAKEFWQRLHFDFMYLIDIEPRTATRYDESLFGIVYSLTFFSNLLTI
jgi:hypothetical protein